MFKPLDRPSHRTGRKLTRRRVLAITIVLTSLTGIAIAWTGWQGSQVSGLVTRLRADADQLARQVRASDLNAAAASLTRLRLDAERARSLTSGPRWAVAQLAPGVGRDIRAVRTVTANIAAILDAARPLERLLPRLDPKAQESTGGRIDVDALVQIAAALPAISAAVDTAAARFQLLDPKVLNPQVAQGVRTLQSAFSTAKGPLKGAADSAALLPRMLGATGPQNYVVLLEQDAEARGTGGLVGSFAVVRTNQGQLSLLDAQSRATLDRGLPIPVSAAPESLQGLWGNDLGEWAGLNLSPHFPWTGQLVAAGWAAQHRSPKVDYVVGLDAYVVAALLAGTGPVKVGNLTLTSANAPAVLSRDVYTTIPDPEQVDQITLALVQQVFGRIAAGQFSLAPILQAMAAPVQQRRLTAWAADPGVQSMLETLSLGGAIPEAAGPFAMAVVNNGGGNKLDAYLKVSTHYDPGTCQQNVRLGHIAVTLTNTAPTRGLPGYVSVRSDLAKQNVPNAVVGSNRIILDVYGPVGATSPLVNLDGTAVAVTAGMDRNHPVWRLDVPINPGQTRTVDVLVVDPVTGGLSGPSTTPVVLTQPMAIPATASAVTQLSPCTAP